MQRPMRLRRRQRARASLDCGYTPNVLLRRGAGNSAFRQFVGTARHSAMSRWLRWRIVPMTMMPVIRGSSDRERQKSSKRDVAA